MKKITKKHKMTTQEYLLDTIRLQNDSIHYLTTGMISLKQQMNELSRCLGFTQGDIDVLEIDVKTLRRQLGVNR